MGSHAGDGLISFTLQGSSGPGIHLGLRRSTAQPGVSEACHRGRLSTSLGASVLFLLPYIHCFFIHVTVGYCWFLLVSAASDTERIDWNGASRTSSVMP